MRRVVLLAAAAMLASLLVGDAAGRSDVAKLRLGITGDPARFATQTGQVSTIRSFFLGWEQSWKWGSRLPVMLERNRPIPMFHIGTKGRNRREAVTPLSIANGSGDGFFAALNQGVAGYGGLVYARLMAEGNHCERHYAAFTCAGGSRGPQYAPQAHADAFARFAAILRGGTAAEINARLAGRGLPPYRGGDLPLNPPSRLRLIWNPLGGARPTVPANGWERFYPGDGAVDLVGNDLYGSSRGWSGPQNEALYAFARMHRKPFSLPEWGLELDDAPEFVQYVCDFIRRRSAVELASYYDAKPGSQWDLQPRPMSRERYRRCLTPLGKPAP